MKQKTAKKSAPKKAAAPKKPASTGKKKGDEQTFPELIAELISAFGDLLCACGIRSVTYTRRVLVPPPCGKPEGVPTSDRIAIPKRVVSQCKKAVAGGKKKKPASSALTKDEAYMVNSLRLKGKSIKAIAKIVHRSDRTVSAFLKSHAKPSKGK